ncbi:hypothetical protein DICSQDRAFT_130611 [Dichomitus squalens LYAD-421 SS1]|uniref:2OGFeDO JBP1/TET oxygenase domain-containing protein n=1 Tax=Dichomitus squalens (strain LYAD-421) TaxID=732165 RepID=R7SK35_DICSQ|nr:uncharacterized protein DICSQDRAFT_130611 [Dichomitus squalens LYAD-421 SS1]EJF55412.1 hypothetical protein DICSQDRAFT_130611 [Dichomitus squalens LYAD-421 SS1]
MAVTSRTWMSWRRCRWMSLRSGTPAPQGDPATRKARAWKGATPQHRLNTIAAKRVREAQTFAHFSLQEAVDNPKTVAEAKKEELPITHTFDGEDGPRRAVSGDGYDLVFHFPGAVKPTTLENVTNAATQLSKVAPPTKKVSGREDHDFCPKGGIVGMTHICQYWHATGHKHRPGGPGLHMRRTVNSYRGTFQFWRDTTALASLCTALLETVDPVQHNLLKRLKEVRLGCDDTPEQKAFESPTRNLFWENLEVIFNRKSAAHFDLSDPHFAWACIVYFGTFEQAYLTFPQLGLRVRIRPGDVVFFRGRDLLHLVEDWGKGDRYLIVYFTHEAAWADFGMGGQCASGKAQFRETATPNTSSGQ